MGQAVEHLVTYHSDNQGDSRIILDTGEVPPRDSTATSPKSAGSRLIIPRLNESQSRTVTEAIGGRLALLWGPPDTGKTSTIISLLREIFVQKRADRVLVAAPTHNAVDHVLR
jgi:Cdc6-like AAA superfamily ATPase